MEHIDAIIKILEAVEAGGYPILLDASTGKQTLLSGFSHVFLVSRLTRLSHVECAQPLPEWGDTFPEGYYHLTFEGHDGLVQIAMPAPITKTK